MPLLRPHLCYGWLSGSPLAAARLGAPCLSKLHRRRAKLGH